MDTPKKIGRYEIMEELGRGAMGAVYRAKDPAMDRVVALKTILSVMTEGTRGGEFRESFYREARAAGALAHPGIVPMFDVGEHEGTPFLVMEFVDGQTLDERMKKGERLTPDRLCEIGQKIAEALGYAHQRKVVHRDVKPANILLTSREAHGIERPKITDFGVAKLAEGQVTTTGQMKGTPAFMSPEQFTGAPIDGRADIYSLGVVLYWMATGEQPFPGESITAVSYKVVHTDPVPPRRLNPSVPAGLESVILRCMAKSPAERYQTAEELAQALGSLRTGVATGTVQMQAPRIAPAMNTDATIVGPSPMATVRGAESYGAKSAEVPVVAKAAAAKSPMGRIALAVAGVIVLSGGWYVFGRHQGLHLAAATPSEQAAATTATAPPPALPAAPPAQTIAAAPAPPKPTAGGPASGSNLMAGTAATAKTASATKPPAANAPLGAATASATSAKMPAVPDATASAPDVPAAPAVKSEPEPLGFDPKALDAKQNARLQIDGSEMPPGLDFTVEMNGKVYFAKTGAAQDLKDEKFFVPPGVQEFRVAAKSGSVEKTSNTVSADFKAKKKSTLKIELRIQGMPAGRGLPNDLYENTQIVATLK